MRIVANIVSVIFHPLLLTSYLVLLLGYYFPSLFMITMNRLLIILAFIFCFTFILPVVNIIMFRMFGTINSYTMVSRQERIIPFVAISLIYVVMTFMFFYKLPISRSLNLLMLIVSLLVISATLLTFFYKVSVHSLAIWGAIGILMPLNKALEQSYLLWPTAMAIIIAGLVMSSRLYLNAHSPRQVLFGSLAGFAIGFFGVILLF
ncbi:MAG: phosphatase PAP2 family protein [Cyclobacteriaceae bacterium]|nr:phosphatase PAP2 family protein [Cyclobacteriaceae bacterium]